MRGALAVALLAVGAGAAGCSSAPDRLAAKEASLEKVPFPPPTVPVGALVRIENANGHYAGAIVDERGIVLSSGRGGMQSQHATLADGRKVEAVPIMWIDENADLLAIRLLPKGSRYPELAYGPTPRVGDPVYTFVPGPPGAKPEVAAGKVAMVDMAFAGGPDSKFFYPMILATVPCFLGDAGAPLVDVQGRVIGIVSTGNPSGSTIAASFRPVTPSLTAVIEIATISLSEGVEPPAQRPGIYLAALRRNMDLLCDHVAWQLSPATEAAYRADWRAEADAVVARLRESWRGRPTLTSAMSEEGLAALREAWDRIDARHRRLARSD